MAPTASIRRNPDFRRLWAGESIMFFGSAVRRLALPLTAVIALQVTPAQMGVLVMLQTLPTLFAGVWIDRLCCVRSARDSDWCSRTVCCGRSCSAAHLTTSAVR